MRFFFLEFFSRLDTVDSRVSIRVVNCVIFSPFCFRNFHNFDKLLFILGCSCFHVIKVFA